MRNGGALEAKEPFRQPRRLRFLYADHGERIADVEIWTEVHEEISFQ